MTSVRIGVKKLKTENVAPMISVLEARASKNWGRRSGASSVAVDAEASTPSPACGAVRRTMARVSAAASSVIAEIAQNADCQPNRPPTKVANGRPSRVPSISPFITTATARPRTRSSTSSTAIDAAMPKNACEAAPPMIRATAIIGYPVARAAMTFPTRKTPKITISADRGGVRRRARMSSGPPTAIAAAKIVTR